MLRLCQRCHARSSELAVPPPAQPDTPACRHEPGGHRAHVFSTSSGEKTCVMHPSDSLPILLGRTLATSSTQSGRRWRSKTGCASADSSTASPMVRAWAHAADCALLPSSHQRTPVTRLRCTCCCESLLERIIFPLWPLRVLAGGSAGESGADVYDRMTILEDHLIRDINAGRSRLQYCNHIVFPAVGSDDFRHCVTHIQESGCCRTALSHCRCIP